MTKMKVITLNCWGIPWSIPTISSPNRLERFEAISEFLSSESYDFVFLQEVWDEQDYLKLKKKLSTSLPHSYYFKAGIIGSGTCIFSVVPIENVYNKTFSINGFPHQVWRGDGLAGSGLGVAQVTLDKKKLLLCVTHFHAEYYGEFRTDRAAQAWEVRNFVKLMEQGDQFDLILIAGDFNSLPGELPHRILSSCLTDCWKENYEITFGNSRNTYAGTEDSETLDYIFVKEGSKVKVTTGNIALPLEQVIPNGDFSYSDHEAIETNIVIEIKEHVKVQNTITGEDLKSLFASIKSDICTTEGRQFEYLTICICMFFMMIFIHHWLLNIFLAIIICFSFGMATITLQARKVALENIIDQIKLETES